MRRLLGLAYFLISAAACSGETGASVPDAHHNSDASTNGSDAALGGPDGPSGGPDAAPAIPDGVQCADMTCAAGTTCCIREVGPTMVAACQDPTAECKPGRLYTCDGPEDCGGEDCCETGTGSSCVPPHTCTGARLCNSPGDCETGEMCCPPPGPSGPFTYDRCIGPPTCPG